MSAPTADSSPADTGARDIAEKLQAYLAGKGLTDPKVGGLRRLTGGSSHDTWAFDLGAFDLGALDLGEGGAITPLVMRRNFAAASLDMSPQAEFDLLSWLAGQGLPVAKPWLCATDDSPFGVPFVLAERIDGTDLRKAVAAQEVSADPAEVAQGLVALQARIHALSLDGCPLATSADPLREAVERWTGALLDAPHAPPGPIARAAAAWLRAHIPAPQRLALVHGDYKANNILWRKDGTPVVLDWELTHIGDPVEDLAWTMLWTSKYDVVGGMLSPADYVAAYEAASGRGVDRFALHYWQLFAFVKLSAILQSGSGSISEDEQLSPSHVLLSRAVPCLEAGMAAHLARLTSEGQAA